jgi:hypothetical protein
VEIGCLRIFTIVWAPNGEMCRTKDMKSFIGRNYEAQIWFSKVDALVKTPVKAVLGLFGMKDQPNVDTGFTGGRGGDEDRENHHHHSGHIGAVHPVRH